MPVGGGTRRTQGVHSPDLVNHPPHYTFGSIEVIDVLEDWNLGYHLGNAVKYIARSPHKGNELQDLQKARWYLNRYIEKLENNEDRTDSTDT
jgi:uncharacterized protein DUF3310